MTMNDIIALAGAGFTKADIMSLMNSQTTVSYQTPAPAPAPAPVVTPQPNMGMPPVPVGAMAQQMVTPPELLQGQLANPALAGQAQSQMLDYAFQQGNYSGMPTQSIVNRQFPNNDQLTNSINALTRAVQAYGISQDLSGGNHVPTVDEMTAAIINPPEIMTRGN